MRYWNVILIILSIFHAGLSQNASKGIVFGIVRDIDTNEGIEFAIVHEAGSDNVVETDINGQYRIEIEADKKTTLIISRIGYVETEINVSPLKLNQKRNINVKLVSKSIDLGIVVRAAKIEDAGIVREEVTELKILPTASGNFESVLPHIALGVNLGSGGELTSQYNVRGGNYDENLVYVNDFEIFRPQLIRSGQQEGLSFPNIDLIRDLEFSSGGFDAKFGDKMSSVLDIRYKRPEETRGSVTGSLLGFTGHIEGSKRIGANAYNKFRYLIGGRFKTNAYLLSASNIQGEYNPKFYDFQAFLSYEISKNWQVGLISNYNASRYLFIPKSGRSKKGTIDFQIELQTNYEGQEVDKFDYGMTGIVFTFVPERDKNPMYMKWMASFYQAGEFENFDIYGQYRLVELETGIGSNTGQEVAVLGEGAEHTFARNSLYNNIFNAEYKGGIELQSNNQRNNHFIQWGCKYQSEFFDDLLHEWSRLDSFDYNVPYKDNGIEFPTLINGNAMIQNTKVSAYLQDGYTISNNDREFKFSFGLRSTYRSLSNEFLISPRLQVLYKPKNTSNEMAYKLSIGQYNQTPFYREMRRRDGTVNTALKSQKSLHIVAGLSYDFTWERVSNRPFRFIAEAYYKTLKDLVSYDVDNVRIRYSGENDAEGYVQGIDFRLNGEFVKDAESWINLSFLRARENIIGVQHEGFKVVGNKRELAPVDNVPRPTDQFMTLNMFFQDYLPKNENIKVNLNFSVGTGLPYGPKDDNLIRRNIFRLKPYHRVDIGFSFLLWNEKWKLQKPNHPLRFTKNAWLSLETFNLLNISNQASVTWIKAITNIEYALPNNLTSRRINLKMRIDF